MIVLEIIVIILLILLIPVGFLLNYGQKLEVRLKYLFLNINLTKEKQKKKSSKETKEEKKTETVKEQKPSLKTKIKNILKEKGAIGFLNIIISLSKPVTKAVAELVKCLRIKDLDIYYKVGGEDASEIATEYGKICSIIYPCVNMFCGLTKIDKPRVTVDLDYSSKKSLSIASCKVTVIPLQILYFLIKHLITITIKATKVMEK